MVYEIFYREIKIGILEINLEGKHRYTPDFEGVKLVGDNAPLIREMKEVSGWINPIPFFQTRIDNAARFSQENDIYYHTDQFRMIKAK